MNFLWFSLFLIMSSRNRNTFTSSFSVWISHTSFSCYIALIRISSITLNRSSEREHPYFVPDVNEKSSKSLAITYDVSCGGFCRSPLSCCKKIDDTTYYFDWFSYTETILHKFHSVMVCNLFLYAWISLRTCLSLF